MEHGIETSLAYEFKNVSLLEAALQHSSSGRPGLRNERLETLGDAVLTLVITEELFHRFPQADEGSITRMKSSLVSSRSLASIASETGLITFARTGPSGGKIPVSIRANIFEALIGAVYLDGGLSAARKSILHLFGPRLEDPSISQVDPKSKLQHILQRTRKILPIYEVVGVSGPPHDRTYSVRVVIAGRAYPAAEAKNKKTAERLAAAAALREIEKEPSQ